MSNLSSASTPVEIDARLAELYYERARIRQAIGLYNKTIVDAAGAKYYYRGRQRVTDMTLQEAEEITTATLDEMADDSDYARLKTSSYSLGQLRTAVAKRAAEYEKLQAVQDETMEVEDLYTGWSRFFLVTSSNGHIHSSTGCHTCRPTTTYGWLPELSDKDMAQAIEHFGPAASCLCSVCFPDAPVDQMDRNMTAKERDSLLEGKTPEANTKQYCPGSGERMIEPSRTGYAYGNYGTCPHCKEHVALTTAYGPKLRKHEIKKAA